MKVDKEVWKQNMKNLMDRRSGATEHKVAASYVAPSKVTDYETHFKKCILGNSVLDVGCGGMTIKKYSPFKYTGIDAYPINEDVIKAEIETFETTEVFDTVTIFAVLDGLYDLEKAINNIKRLCSGNIIILTGLGIKPDKYHTIEIKEEDLIALMLPEFIQSHREELIPNVYLLEYKRR